MDSKVKRRINILTYSLLAVFAGIAVFSAVKLNGILKVNREEKEYYSDLTETFTQINENAYAGSNGSEKGQENTPASNDEGLPAKTDTATEEGEKSESESERKTSGSKHRADRPVEKAAADMSEIVPWYEMLQVDLKGLKALNSDVAGWIFLENEPGISYPVVYSGDDEKYLRAGLDGKYLKSGTIFLEGRNSPSFDEFHEIIYGHNMKNDTMFGLLDNYVSDDAYLDGHRFFQLFTEEGIYRYKIIAFRKISPHDDFFFTGNVPASDYKAFTDNYIVKGSIIEVDYEFGENDRLITLATCADSGKKRFIVTGVRTEEFIY